MIAYSLLIYHTAIDKVKTNELRRWTMKAAKRTSKPKGGVKPTVAVKAKAVARKAPPKSQVRVVAVGSPEGVVDPNAEACYLSDRRGGVSTALDVATQRLWASCHYPTNLTFNHYYDMYARNNVAARVIETFPNYTWNTIPIVQDAGGESSRFSKKVADLLTMPFKWKDGIKQDLLTTMKQLDVLGGIGGEALLVFGFNDGGQLHTKVVPKRTNEIKWVKILHNGQFKVKTKDENKASPDYGDVITYETKTFSATREINFVNNIADGVEIHSTRCVHFKETNGLPYGTSRIQKCYNQLLDIVKVSGASAEVYWLGAFSGLAVETRENTALDEDSYTVMKEEIEKYFAGLERSLVFEGAESKLLYPAIVSPQAHFDLQISMVSIATEIPRRFLTGAEAAKLASQQDSINWMDRVSNRRNGFVGPCVVSPVVQRCVDAGVLSRPKGGVIKVVWAQTQSLALNDRADAAKGTTEAIVEYFTSGVSKVMEFREYLIGVCGYGEEEATRLAEKTDAKKYKPPVTNTPSTTPTKKATVPVKKKSSDKGDANTSIAASIVAENQELKDTIQQLNRRMVTIENKSRRKK